MDKHRRRVTLGLLSAPLVATLAGCNSSNDSEGSPVDFSTTLTERLSAELHDEQTARRLAPFIEEACFNMTPSRVVIDSVNCVIAFAFGNRPNASGNPDELAEPGPMNEALAACCAALYRQKPVPMYVQWEIACFLDSKAYGDIPTTDIIPIKPYWDDAGKLIYLSTDDVVKKIIEEHTQDQDPATLGMAAIIGHRDHVKRCIMTCRARKVASHAPEGIALPVWYDEQSAQPWTRRRDLYVLQDISAQLMGVAKANIAQAYPDG